MQLIPEKTKLLALAYLKNGMRPKQVADALDGLSYHQALKLRKELDEAEEQNTLAQLFSLDALALEALLDSVKQQMQPVEEQLTGELQTVEDAVNTLADKIHGAKVLEESLQKAATALAHQITAKALLASTPDSLLVLAEALAKLQSAFFAKGMNVQVNNYQQFDKYLTD